jgi:hypothetical protein
MHAEKECCYCIQKEHIESDCQTKLRDVANDTARSTAREGANSGSGVQTSQSNAANGLGGGQPGSQPGQPQRIRRCQNCLGFGHSSATCSSSRNPVSGNGRAARQPTGLDDSDYQYREKSTWSGVGNNFYTYMASFVNESDPAPVARFREPLPAVENSDEELVDE